jgi:uncharacterized protein
MSTKRVTIPSPRGLEGIMESGSPNAGVVICHPHPLYGGDMYSNVVGAMEEGFSSIGFTTLKFNFRGVGGSGGSYDEGEGEVDDLTHALQFLRGHLDGDAHIILAGYSFGSWICSRASARAGDVEGLFLVAYPFSVYDTADLARYNGKVWFVGGTLDDICPLDALVKFYKSLSLIDKHLKVIPTDHFYGGKEGEIAGFIRDRVNLS